MAKWLTRGDPKTSLRNFRRKENTKFTMKRILVCLAIVTLLSKCKEVDEFTQFEMEFTEEISFPAGTELNIPFEITSPDINTEYQDVYESYNTKADRIEEIQLKELELTISSPQLGSFDFLESIQIAISSAGMDEMDIASIYEIPNSGESVIELETSKVNLKDYLSIDQFGFKLNSVADQGLAEDYTISVRSIFFVDARVLGQ